MLLLAFTGWALWNRRNQIRLNEAACPLNQVLQVSKERKLEFQLLHPVTPKLQHRKHTRWKSPDVDSFKVNYDVVTFNEQGKAGIGVVIRNSEGAVMASLSQQAPLPATVAQVEALAARRAIEFALEVGITQAIIKGDSDIIFKGLTSPGLSLALHGHLIHDVKQLANAFTNINFTHVRRPGNTVGHGLARRGNKDAQFNCLDGKCTTRYSVICAS